MRFIGFLLAGSSLSFTIAAQAAETPLYQPAADWVAAADAPLPPGDGTSPWLLNDRQILLEADKRSTFTDTAIRIQSADMLRNWSDMTFEWQPDRDDLIVHRIQILRGNAVIDLLGQGLRLTVLRREKDFEQKTIDGILTATAAIEDLRVGDTVRFSATLVERTDVLKNNSEANIDLPAQPSPIANGSVRVVWPRTLPVKWKAFGKGIAPVEQDKGAWHVLTQAQPLVKQEDMPKDAPVRYQRPPAMEFSTFASWTDLSRTMAPLFATAGTIKEDGALAAEVARIAQASTDPKIRANQALQLVQNEVRYLYNGLANGNYVPQAPEQTWALRYGDCKAKTLLLLAIMDRLGIAAEPALVHSVMGDSLPGRLPTMGAFNHVLVRADIGGTDYWLDGTTAGAHIEDLADVPPFRFALPLTVQGQDLQALPIREPARPEVLVAVDYDQSAGTAFPPLVHIALTARGVMAAQLAAAKAQAKPEQIREFTQNLLGGFINGGTLYTRSIEIDDAKGTATINAEGLGNLSWDRSEQRPAVSMDGLISDFELQADRSRPAWRDIPVVTGPPALFVRKVSLKLPASAGFAIEGDARADIRIASFTMHRDASLTGGRLEQTESVWSDGSELAADRLPATRAQVADAKKREFRLRAPDGYPTRVEEIAEAKKEKRLTALLAAYQKAIDDNPDVATGYENRAAFQIGIFEPRAAIADLDEAIKREPSVELYQRRAVQYATLGDRKAALADVDQALALDPGSEDAISQKILMLADLGQFDAALGLVDDQMASAKDKRNWASLKADTLGKAGRAEEGAALLIDALAERPGDPGLLNALCWLRGTRSIQLDRALKDCTRAIELTDDPAQVLDSRAMVYFRLNRMDEARADLDAALKIAPGLTGSLFMRSVVRGRGNERDGARADMALARMQDGNIDTEYAGYGIKP